MNFENFATEERRKRAWQRLIINGGWKLRYRFAMKKFVDGIPGLSRIYNSQDDEEMSEGMKTFMARIIAE
jgi:hypothetical protein